MSNIDRSMFRQYDIRGVYGQDLTEEAAMLLGKAFGTYVRRNGKNTVMVGRDNRSSSLPLRNALVNGLLSTGCDVLDIGLVTTPLCYYSRILYDIDPAIMITASHNPPKFNGFKVCYGPATLYGDEIQMLCDMIEGDDFTEDKAGHISYAYPMMDYINMICEKIELGPHKLKVAIDCGNGTASLVHPQAIYRLGCDVVPIYCDSDPSFPNHFPDPVKAENLEDLRKIVLEEKADLGIGFDGDGDRIGIIDDKGNIIWGDTLMILFWREILPKYPGTTAIVEVKCSQALAEEIERLGGKPMFYKTGHSLIKAKMREIGSVFAGEMSGHMFFADEYYGFDDALYAAARLLRILSNTDKSLSELLADVPRYPSTPELRIHCDDDKKFAIVEQAKAFFKDKGYPIIDVDGVRAIIDGGWGLIRASNTGPEIIARCEAKTEDQLKYIKELVGQAIAPLKLEE